jgi:hypothetical protein
VDDEFTHSIPATFLLCNESMAATITMAARTIAISLMNHFELIFTIFDILRLVVTNSDVVALANLLTTLCEVVNIVLGVAMEFI